ncbi:MAG: aminotransferase class V-fold PLP-dependent enzyme [Anaerolineae bacterium]|nr:aminotransferase class V-fold PLP-dependent enzyme [Anaerolineae bacterium]
MPKWIDLLKDLTLSNLNFRDLFLLSPNVVFLNHGSFGACPRPVFEVYQQWQLELERQPVEFLGRRFGALMREAREVLGAYLGVASDDLVYIPNATTGVNIVARSLPLAPGDEVLATDHEYGACERAWRFVCEKRGAHYVRQPIPVPVESPEQVVEAVWSGVTPRTKVLYLSHITSPTALILPIAELIRRAREHGILTVIDGAHAPGQIPLALDALGVDFYTGNAHKWMLAPKGAAFLYARREVQPLLEPLVVSWGWQAERPGPSRFIDEQEYQGTRDIAAYLSVPAAIRFMAEHDWPTVRAECHALLCEAGKRIGALTGLPSLSPLTAPWYAQMAAFLLPPCDLDALKQRLYDESRIEIPLIPWNEHGLIRLSLQGYNTRDDLEALLGALAVCLRDTG